MVPSLGALPPAAEDRGQLRELPLRRLSHRLQLLPNAEKKLHLEVIDAMPINDSARGPTGFCTWNAGTKRVLNKLFD